MNIPLFYMCENFHPGLYILKDYVIKIKLYLLMS